jgi:hypothetical protein
MSWGSLVKGQAVKIYVNGGWKSGVIATVYDNSCSVLWTVGSTQKITRIYDVRNVKVQ